MRQDAVFVLLQLLVQVTHLARRVVTMSAIFTLHGNYLAPCTPPRCYSLISENLEKTLLLHFLAFFSNPSKVRDIDASASKVLLLIFLKGIILVNSRRFMFKRILGYHMICTILPLTVKISM